MPVLAAAARRPWPRPRRPVLRHEYRENATNRGAAGRVEELAGQSELLAHSRAVGEFGLPGGGATDLCGVVQHIQGQDPADRTHQYQLALFRQNDMAEGGFAGLPHGRGHDAKGVPRRRAVGE